MAVVVLLFGGGVKWPSVAGVGEGGQGSWRVRLRCCACEGLHACLGCGGFKVESSYEALLPYHLYIPEAGRSCSISQGNTQCQYVAGRLPAC